MATAAKEGASEVEGEEGNLGGMATTGSATVEATSTTTVTEEDTNAPSVKLLITEQTQSLAVLLLAGKTFIINQVQGIFIHK